MTKRLALKRFSHTDLTWFEEYYRSPQNLNKVEREDGSVVYEPRARQKAINIDARLLKKIYPNVMENIKNEKASFLVQVTIYGPDLSFTPQVEARPLLLQKKNWRLNGRTIHTAPNHPNRYSKLRKGDVAIFQFEGDEKPEELRIILLNDEVIEQSSLISMLARQVGSSRTSMVVISEPGLRGMLTDAALPPEHPAWMLTRTDAEDSEGLPLEPVSRDTFVPYAKRHRRTSTKAGLLESMNRRREAGDKGEEWIRGRLEEMLDAGALIDYKWVSSEEDAVAPYDFRVTPTGEEEFFMDVKSTDGDFSSQLVMSYAELLEAAYGPTPYRLCRVWGVSTSTPSYRLTAPLREVLLPVADHLAAMGRMDPTAVAVGVRLHPEELPWELGYLQGS